MHLILCVDNRDGLSFCGRRLSRDRRLCEQILQLTTGSTLWMSAYSEPLFPGASVRVDEDFQHRAGKGEYCFLEVTPLLDAYNDLESVILYHWNRDYPATTKFPRTLLDAMHLAYSEEFPGSSHEMITMERYTL